jgi:hypothetical protein
MPCQCGTTATVASDADITYSACECAAESEAGCECGTGAPPDSSLERLVMELDKRVRKLEANR